VIGGFWNGLSVSGASGENASAASASPRKADTKISRFVMNPSRASADLLCGAAVKTSFCGRLPRKAGFFKAAI
jgi:hypothetical protein